MVFLETKKIELTLNFDSGVLQVKGSNLDQWIKNDFENIKQRVGGSSVEPAGTESGSGIKSEEKLERKTEEIDIKEEISSIWADIVSLKTALQSVEAGLLKLTDRLDGINVVLKEKVNTHVKELEKVEKNLDGKVILFQEVTEASVKKEIDKVLSDTNNKIRGVKEVVNNFKTQVQSKVDSFGYTPTEDLVEMRKDIDSMKAEFAKLDPGAVKNAINEIDGEYKDKWLSLETKIGNVRDDLRNEREIKLAGLDERIEHLRSEVISFATSGSTTQRVNNEGLSNNMTSSTNNGSSIDHTNNIHGEHAKIDDKIKLIMCMDSNARFLNRRKLWDLDGTEYNKCFTIPQVDSIISRNIKYTKLEYFMMSVGCNDLDHKEARDVFESMKKVVNKLCCLYPGVKVIIGEITPRMDAKDAAVKEVNELINRYGKTLKDVFIIRNSNLRDPKFFSPTDNKHILEDCIGLFASNIKHTLRAAYGRKKWVPTYNHNHNDNQQYHRRQRGQQHQQSHQQHDYLKQQQQQQQQFQVQQQLLQWYLKLLGAQIGRVSDTRAADAIAGT